ncbi:MAG: hypothetical protein K2O01_06750, partial [Bacteroidales bacterium]|nr:hypothetical protein [Bacteroidales bacterium]
MRKGGLVCLFLCWLCSLWAVTAQTLAERERVELKRRQVPKEVRRNVRLAYPYHIYKDWAKVDTLYSVRVISVNYETVYFDATGEWLRAYRPVRPSELPYKTYLFLKEEFGGYRVLRAYQVQQSDDLAHYSVEMEHKRIHSLKTYLEFNFVGDLTVLDGKAVGIVQDKTAGEAALSQQTWASLYADAYDPVAEEAAYAAEAKVAAEAMVATVDTTVVQLAVMPADTVVCVDTVTLTTDSLPLVHTDTVMLVDTVDAVDTVTLEPDTVLAVVPDTLVAEGDTAAIQPAAVSADTILPADT